MYCGCSASYSVPMALGKHLFSFRTQKLSPAAAIILRKRETSTVPNYALKPPEKVAFRLSKNARGKIKRRCLRKETHSNTLFLPLKERGDGIGHGHLYAKYYWLVVLSLSSLSSVLWLVRYSFHMLAATAITGLLSCRSCKNPVIADMRCNIQTSYR